jgi:flagellar biogenesis protein FliO
LALVVGLIFITRILIRRFAPTTRVTRRDQLVGILTRTNVGPRRQLLVVRFGKRLLLVGSGPDGLSNLSEVQDREEVREMLESITGSGEGGLRFAREKEPASSEASDLEKHR